MNHDRSNILLPIMKQKNPNSTTNRHQSTVCGQCGVEDRRFLHNVRHRTTFRRLCTTCVLRLHPQSFCPSCLAVYDRSPPIDAVICNKCYSSSHPTCVPVPIPITGATNSSGRSVPCSSCVNPNLLVLNLNRLDDRIGGRTVDRIDGNAARLLLAAAKIAAMSMSKAEVSAAMEAERRAKEAAYTKKRAREALDHVLCLMKEKCSKKVLDVCTVKRNVDGSSEVLDGLSAVELKENGDVVSGTRGNAVLVVDVVSCKDSGVGSGCENGQEH